MSFMDAAPSTAEKGTPPDVRLLVEKMIKLKTNKWIEKSKNKIFASKLMDAQLELFNAEKMHLELRLKTENLARELHDIEKKASSFVSNIKQYDALISQLPSVSEDLDEDADCDVSAMREIQSIAQNFLKESNSSPWILEKRQHQHCLQEDENRLEITKRQLSLLENKINEKKNLLEAHNNLSMHKFCLSLASFSRNKTVLKNLLTKEEGTRRDMMKKLGAFLDNSSMDESGVCDGDEPSGYLAFRRKTKKSALPKRPSLMKSLAHFSPKFLAPRPPPTFISETHTAKDTPTRTEEMEDDLSQSSVEDEDNEPEGVDDRRNEEHFDVAVLDHNKKRESSTQKGAKTHFEASQFFLHFSPTNMNLNTSNEKNPFGF